MQEKVKLNIRYLKQNVSCNQTNNIMFLHHRISRRYSRRLIPYPIVNVPLVLPSMTNSKKLVLLTAAR